MSGGALDSDQYRCLATGDRVDLAPSPMVDQSTLAGALSLIYSIAGLCMAATVAVVTGMGMTRLAQPPVELDDRSQADHASPVIGSADTDVD
jgi:hypothetical protein